ncbi:transporter substrate-binding domain-containing protein [Thalassotalea sp. G2M2-11]|uniref:substrate-binding periplasmic protein n=1 Tax=Thalassotalea sp. G2M2-11 TaxID=2787627 RepID=UPI0019CF9DD3|nr:transporter substrate-binding domain-containing protein [Thalassotalea sp. G2M2-11]
MKKITTIIFFIIVFSFQAIAEEINVGLEPFPPLINEDGTGVIIDIFNQISSHSDLSFNIHLMTYARAKRDLKNHQLDIAGLTPKNNETESFYQYGHELDWSFKTNVDIFTYQKPPINIKQLPEYSVGTLLGNAEFFAQVLNMPINKFVEVSSLPQLVKMLAKGRIQSIVFERISTMTTIKQLNKQGIYYQKIANIPASLAVQNNDKGKQLKQKLDQLLIQSQITIQNKKLEFYNTLTDTGQVSVAKH